MATVRKRIGIPRASSFHKTVPDSVLVVPRRGLATVPHRTIEADGRNRCCA